ncbi:putative DNA helicase transcription regulator Homeodomain-LIKE family [Medicago truncatula]|uniref:Putative DNA helicase transcription regulator Homeodomain-LIKE family n=1 Tax=Medicago truncatula TaxID=3880 RepID=A0A396JFE4_MEDTR|nr:putative DNA helicase transcription regulator Homeodomain-LIKE family [Medicago truncatula]
MARAHRVGQTNKVLIFRLITRGTIEERMMEITKKKMVLEHVVVGRKAQNIKQEELDDIIRYGSKELFADENDVAGKSRQIHYDDAAIDRLLGRDQVGAEEATLNDEDESGFLKAFKVANFEFIDKGEASEGKNFWEELLKDKYQEQKVEVQNALGKGKRNRTTLLGENFARLEGVGSSDYEDDDYEVDHTDGDSNSTRTTTSKRPSKKTARNTYQYSLIISFLILEFIYLSLTMMLIYSLAADNTNPPALMEGEGKSLKVIGFTQRQRAAFLQLLMRFGVGDFDWKDFIPHMKQKTCEEINEYGALFLSHIAEDINDSPAFSDGVPKEGLQIVEVLVRISVLSLIREKVKFASENPGTPLFSDDILSRYAGLRSTKIWKEEHDLVLLHAVLKHGYGKWHDIVDDKDLNIQRVICQELSTPFINLPSLGQVGSQVKNGANMTNVESPSNQSRENNGSAAAVNGAHGSYDARSQEPLYQLSDLLLQFRNMQRRQIDFIRKRFPLLENCLNDEYCQKEYSDKMEATAGTYQETRNESTQTPTIYQLPQVEKISMNLHL